MEPKEETYSAREAATILRRSKRRILQMIERGELEGEKEEGGQWRIPQRAVHALLEDRPPRSAGGRGGDAISDPERVRNLEAAVADLHYRLGRAEARAELTEVAESTLREALERERERADRLEAQLAQRQGPWWRRLFGG